MTAENVPLIIDQGEDFTCQIVWTDDQGEAQNITAPIRLDVRGGLPMPVVSLTTPTVEDPDIIPLISYSSDIGLIQLHIPKEMTANLPAGQYTYDMFVTVNDGDAYAGNQVVRLMAGEAIVNRRVTVMS